MEISEIRALGQEKILELAEKLGIDGTSELSPAELEMAVMRALADRQELSGTNPAYLVATMSTFPRRKSASSPSRTGTS